MHLDGSEIGADAATPDRVERVAVLCSLPLQRGVSGMAATAGLDVLIKVDDRASFLRADRLWSWQCRSSAVQVTGVLACGSTMERFLPVIDSQYPSIASRGQRVADAPSTCCQRVHAHANRGLR